MKQFEALTHKDVKGKELYYIRLSSGGRIHIINVGKKTHDEVKKMDLPDENENQLTLPIVGNDLVERDEEGRDIQSGNLVMDTTASIAQKVAMREAEEKKKEDKKLKDNKNNK